MSGKSFWFPSLAALALGLGGVLLPVPSARADTPPETEQVAAVAAPGFLGVAVAETRLSAEHAGDRPAVALVVSHVRPGTPADAAGLLSGDVLLQLDGQTLVHPVQFQRLVAARPAGESITLTLRRDGQTIEKPATLGERPENPAARPLDPPARGALPDGEPPRPMRDDLRRMQEQMDRQFEEMRRLFREGMDDGWPGMDLWQPLRPMDFDFDFGDLGAGANVRQVFVSDDGQHRLTLTRTGDGHQHLHATDAEGAVLFDGPVDTAEQRAELPKPVGEKLERMRSRPPFAAPEAAPGERVAPPRRQAV
ncbi:MAG: PDZ domain-containing protein [Planctomycetota bacterium]